MSLLSNITHLERRLQKIAIKGPRGGEILGYRNGKPIYDRHDHPGNKHLDSEGHSHAADLHFTNAYAAYQEGDKDLEKHHLNEARKHQQISSHLSKAAFKKISYTIGPRGGHIIGKDRNGDPIYDTGVGESHETHHYMSPESHDDAANAHDKLVVDDSLDSQYHSHMRDHHKNMSKLKSLDQIHKTLNIKDDPENFLFTGNARDEVERAARYNLYDAQKVLKQKKKVANDDQAALKKHFQEYLHKHPKSKMNFEQFKADYGEGLVGKIKDKKSQIIGFTNNPSKKTGELKPIYNWSEHPKHKDFSFEDNQDAMKAQFQKASEISNHPLSFLYKKDIEYHKNQAIQHGLKRPRDPVKAFIYDLKKRLAVLDSDALIKRRYENYLKQHPQSQMKFEHFKSLYGDHITGKSSDKLLGFTNQVDKKTNELRPIFDDANHDSHTNLGSEGHKDAMNLHAQQIQKLKNHPISALNKPLIEHHTKQFIRHKQKRNNILNPEPSVYDFTKFL